MVRVTRLGSGSAPPTIAFIYDASQKMDGHGRIGAEAERGRGAPHNPVIAGEQPVPIDVDEALAHRRFSDAKVVHDRLQLVGRVVGSGLFGPEG
jgi:hypothetical protein